MSERPYPIDEQCDWCMSHMAVFRVLDQDRCEIAISCKECASNYQRIFEDSNGKTYSPPERVVR